MRLHAFHFEPVGRNLLNTSAVLPRNVTSDRVESSKKVTTKESITEEFEIVFPGPLR